MAKKRQQWQAGDNFLVPLKDGTFGQGQVVIASSRAMNSVVCVISSTLYRAKPLSLRGPELKDSIAILFVTRDLLDSGKWQIVSNEPNAWGAGYIDFSKLEGKGFIGVTITGSANVESLLNAFHCLEPWNNFHDPNYLDGLLLSPKLKPASVLLKENL